MQQISAELEAEIQDSSQTVRPRVIAQWANNRILDNLRVVSTGDSWYLSSTDEQDVLPDVYWRANDLGGATFAQDFSGHGYNGVVAGGVTAGDASTPLSGDDGSKSFVTGGSSGYTSLANSNACSLNSTNATIEGWFKSSSTSAQGLFANYGGGNEVKVETNASGQINMSITGTVSQSTTVITNGVWRYIALTKAGNVWRLYVDGAQVVTQTKATSGGFTTTRVGATQSLEFVGNYCEFVSSPRAKDAVEVSLRLYQTLAPSTYKFFVGKELFNGRPRQTFAWAVCDSTDEIGQPIRANGKFYAMGDERSSEHEYGFRSIRRTAVVYQSTHGKMSGEDVQIYATFTLRKANKINVYLPDFYGGALQLASVKYLDINGAQIDIGALNPLLALTDRKTTFVLSNDDSPVDITGILVAVNATDILGDSINIEEIEIAYEEDISADIVSITIDKVRDNFDSSVPLGSTAANSMSLTLQNTERRYNVENEDSDISPYVRKDVKFEVELGWIIS